MSADEGEFSIEAIFFSGIHNFCGQQSLEIYPDAWEKGILGLSLDSPPPGVLYDLLRQCPCLHFPGHGASRFTETRFPFFPLRKTIRPALSNHRRVFLALWQKCNVQNVIISALKFLAAPFNMKLWLMDVHGGKGKPGPASLSAACLLCSDVGTRPGRKAQKHTDRGSP